MNQLAPDIPPPATKQNSCAHCGLPVPTERLSNHDANQPAFCCSGCEYVYQIINGLGLKQFYKLKASQAGITPVAARPTKSSFDHFAGEEFEQLYIRPLDDSIKQITFSVEGMHCAACVWLVERLAHVLNGVREARVNFGNASVSVTYDPTKVAPPKIAETLDSFGYPPRPKGSDETLGAPQTTQRQLLIRLAVAGICAGNTMMIAISLYQGEYSGIEAKYSSFFHWTSLLLTLPAVLYSAVPFYRAAWSGLRAGILHIDLPISVGISIGFAASVVNTLRGSANVYYDSVCALIFLLLIGRWIQNKSVARALSGSDLFFNLAPSRARRRSESGIEEVFAGALQPGDLIEVGPDSGIPADGVVASGASDVQTSLLTGESRPEPVSIGNQVFAGTHNISHPLTITVTAAHRLSRVGKLVEQIEHVQREKSPIVSATDRVSGYFVFVVLSLTAVTATVVGLSHGFFEALDRSLALLVITCPCALGLAAPLSLSVALRNAARQGILIRGADIIERLTRIRRIFFDKTGTLTEGAIAIGAFSVLPQSQLSETRILQIVQQLESTNVHPVGKALRSFAETTLAGHAEPNIAFDNVQYLPGKGVQGTTVDGHCWQLGSVTWLGEADDNGADANAAIEKLLRDDLSPQLLLCDGVVVAIFGAGDTIRTGAKEMLRAIRRRSISTSVLSGDIAQIVQSVGRQLEFSDDQLVAESSPEDKLRHVSEAEQQQPTAMIGDGVNDAAAMKAANVGIAVAGGAEACLQSADVYLSDPAPDRMLQTFVGAEKTLKVIHRNLLFSLMYNVVGASAAIAGLVSPLVAAILMPLSSLTVVISSVSTKAFR